jgi:hypothetical protein
VVCAIAALRLAESCTDGLVDESEQLAANASPAMTAERERSLEGFGMAAGLFKSRARAPEPARNDLPGIQVYHKIFSSLMCEVC